MSRSKLVWVIVLAVMLASSATAGGKGAIGFKIGLSQSDQTWEYEKDLGKIERDARTGLAIGMFLDFPINRVVTIRPELLYIRKGSQLELEIRDYTGLPAGTMTSKDRMDYLSLLITGKFDLGLLRPLNVYLVGGPRLDVKLSTGSDVDSQEMETILNSFKTAVPGLMLGVGVEKGIGELATLLVEFRYDYDFSEAMKLDNSINDITIDNRTMTLLAGIKF